MILNKLIKGLVILVIGLFITSCDDSFLDEGPKSFLSPENAYLNESGLEAGIAELHRRARGLRSSDIARSIQTGGEMDKFYSTIYANGTDLASFAVPAQNYANYSTLNAFDPGVYTYWRMLWKIISNSNVIITRVQNANISEDLKINYEARARFFRGFAYRYLVHLWGGVPIINEEINSPKLDFSRSTKEEVLSFMEADFEFASANLAIVNPGNGLLSKAAADHMLTETRIALGDYTGAIAAATAVIDDSQYALMTNRFGNWTSLPGDVFWDLFRLGNQNATSGNTEGIWVWQFDFETQNGSPRLDLTRNWAPLIINRPQVVDSDGKFAIVPADSIGRGGGFIIPNDYMDTTLWLSEPLSSTPSETPISPDLSDFNADIRNSSFNMQRRWNNNNPASSEFGQLVTVPPAGRSRFHYVFNKKAGSPEGYLQGYDASGVFYTDMYAIRLAETYLLRAEAHLMNGDVSSAAADINVVRARAGASLVAGSDVNLDFLLDERARELMVEEPRRLTLARTGTLVERTRKYNPINGPLIQDFHNLWPIPQFDIDANSNVSLEQNPGY